MFVLRNSLFLGLCLSLLVPPHLMAEEISFGGQYVTSEKVPHFASLRLETDGLPFCSASIITVKALVTAAHCKRNGEIQVKVWAGSENGISTGSTQIRDVASIKVHPNYVYGQTHNDIAVVSLNRPFAWTTTVQPIPLPKVNSHVEGIANVTVWKNSRLYRANVSIMPHLECQLKISANNLSYLIDGRTVCAGSLTTAGSGVCMGDHGGPVVQNGVLVGTPVWNINPCVGETFPLPFIMLKVSPFVEWIAENV